jgi:hypothetical protein
MSSISPSHLGSIYYHLPLSMLLTTERLGAQIFVAGRDQLAELSILLEVNVLGRVIIQEKLVVE